MKKIFLFTAAVLMSIGMLSAQKPGSRLPLKVYVEQLPQPFPANAQVTMVSKIHQMLTANGIASTDMYSDFIFTVTANPLEKEIVSGAPTQIMQNLEFTFYIVDANRQVVFSTYSTTSKGVGQSEAKSYIDAMKRVNIKSPAVVSFIDQGRKKIIAYYDAEAQNIFANARSLATQKHFDEAFYLLCGFPTECSQYAASIEVGNEIYKSYVDYQGQLLLGQARAAWAAKQNSEGAAAAGQYLAAILPEASCYAEALALYEEMKAKVREDWEWEMKKYQDGVDLEKMRVQAWQAVGVAYGENQQQTTTNLAWLR